MSPLGSSAGGGNIPWDEKAPNLTEQTRILAENSDRARQMVKAAEVESAARAGGALIMPTPAGR